MNVGRLISGVVVLGYAAFAYWGGGAVGVVTVLGLFVWPIACIWFGDALGGYTGGKFTRGPAVTETSPGCVVEFLGWVLLVLAAGWLGYLFWVKGE